MGYFTTALMLSKVIAAFIILYIFLPSKTLRFDEEARGFLDKLFISFVHMVFVTIVLAHVLVLLHLYETLSLILGYAVAYFMISSIRKRSILPSASLFKLKAVGNLLDASDNRKKFIIELFRLLRNWLLKNYKNLASSIIYIFKNPFAGILPLCAFSFAVALRFEYSFKNAAYAENDPYLHLIWSKYLGYNDLFMSGIYPRGFHAVISAMNKVFLIDPYWICRFIGAVTGAMLVLSVYYVAVRVTKSHGAALITAVIYGLVNHESFPALVSRQTIALSQEFAYVFLLPGIYFLYLFITTNKTRFLLLFAQAMAIILFIHTYVAIYMALWSCILIAVSIPFSGLRLKANFKIFVFSSAAAAITMIPTFAGLLSGHSPHKSSFDLLKISVPVARLVSDTIKLVTAKPLTGSIFLDAVLLILPLVALMAVFKRNRTTSMLIVFTGSITLLMYMMYRLPEAVGTALPLLLDKPRTGQAFAIILGVYYACGFAAFEELIRTIYKNKLEKVKSVFLKSVSIIACVSVLCFFWPKPMNYGAYEYNEAAQSYIQIKSRFNAGDWTIIAPFEQLTQTVGFGWHYEIYRMVKNFGLNDVEKTSFDFPIPTKHIFVFTEKKQLQNGRNITETDALKELEPEGSDITAQYYFNFSQRAILQAKASRLMEAYRKNHNNVSIFFENENMKVYHILQRNPERFIKE